MQDLPFSRYTFILHFPREGGSTGGMEHRDGAAIAIPASAIRNNDGYLESVAAHEFFHAWNVKRIRPQSLEPVDYINGNDTRDLWLCEGVTNTYAQLALLRADLIDRDTFYERVAGAIEVLAKPQRAPLPECRDVRPGSVAGEILRLQSFRPQHFVLQQRGIARLFAGSGHPPRQP